MDTIEKPLQIRIVEAVSKAGRPYRCIELFLGDDSVGRIYARPIEIRSVEEALARQESY